MAIMNMNQATDSCTKPIPRNPEDNEIICLFKYLDSKLTKLVKKISPINFTLSFVLGANY